MSVHASIQAALSGDPGAPWQRELALTLATSMDDKPSASTARELRSVMTDLGVTLEAKGDVSDDLASKRAARRAAGSSAGS